MRISNWSSDVCSADLPLARGDEDADGAVGEDVMHRRRAQDGVDRHEDRPRQRRPEEGDDRLEALVEPHADALAARDAELRQRGGVAFDGGPEFAVGKPPVLQDERRRLWPALCAAQHELVEGLDHAVPLLRRFRPCETMTLQGTATACKL